MRLKRIVKMDASIKRIYIVLCRCTCQSGKSFKTETGEEGKGGEKGQVDANQPSCARRDQLDSRRAFCVPGMNEIYR